MPYLAIKKLVLFMLAASLILAGCSVSPPPPTHYFLLEYPLSPQNLPLTPSAQDFTINLGEISMTAPYDGDNLVVKLKGGEIQFYNYQKWGAPPAKMIQNFLNKTFLFENKFNISDHRLRTKDSYLLKIEFEEFAHNRENQNHYGSLVVFAGLTRSSKANFEWYQVYQIEIPTESDQVSDIIKALNSGIHQFTQALIKDLDQFLIQTTKY